MLQTNRKPIARSALRRSAAQAAWRFALLAAVSAPAAAACLDEESFQPGLPEPATVATAAPIDPRATLQGLVRDALERSHAVGAARTLAAAALDDIEEAAAAKRVQASLSTGLGPGGSRSLAGSETSTMQLRASINLSQLLYDGGRTDRLNDWRTQLAESARFGAMTASEQLALNTVSLALERSRYRQHVVVYGQYVRKMACLLEALEGIVRTDRGRASELVQARKSLQQAELAQAQAASQARQVDVRLRRLVGDGLPATEGMTTVLLQVPPLEQLLAEVETSSEIAGLAAQAQAMDRYAQAVAAGGKPQVSWIVSGSASTGGGGSAGTTRNSNYSLGVAVNIPLLSPGLEPATSAARKRAQAAELQRAEALDARRYRTVEVHEQTLASMDRARRTAQVLRDSEQVRNFTLQQWQQLGRRSLFDVMGAESEHYNLRISYINALIDGQQFNANLLSLGRGVSQWLR
jgi:adhesin transport system outer membrane protein